MVRHLAAAGGWGGKQLLQHFTILALVDGCAYRVLCCKQAPIGGALRSMSPPTTDQPLTPDSIAESSKDHMFNQALLGFQREIGLRYDPITVIEIMHKHDLFWYAQPAELGIAVYLCHVKGKCIVSWLNKGAGTEDLCVALSLLLGIPALLLISQVTNSEVKTVDADKTPLESVKQESKADPVITKIADTESSSPQSLSKSLDDPLTEEEIQSIRDVLKAQTPEVKRDYPIRFKGAFPGLVPDDARAVTPYHTQYRHVLFFQDYINELEGFPAAD